MRLNSKPPPGKKHVADWVGLKVRTKRQLHNGVASIPAGTVCDVVSTGPGLKLWGGKCRRCGMRPYITHVDTRDVEVAE